MQQNTISFENNASDFSESTAGSPKQSECKNSKINCKLEYNTLCSSAPGVNPDYFKTADEGTALSYNWKATAAQNFVKECSQTDRLGWTKGYYCTDMSSPAPPSQWCAHIEDATWKSCKPGPSSSSSCKVLSDDDSKPNPYDFEIVDVSAKQDNSFFAGICKDENSKPVSCCKVGADLQLVSTDTEGIPKDTTMAFECTASLLLVIGTVLTVAVVKNKELTDLIRHLLTV